MRKHLPHHPTTSSRQRAPSSNILLSAEGPEQCLSSSSLPMSNMSTRADVLSVLQFLHKLWKLKARVVTRCFSPEVAQLWAQPRAAFPTPVVRPLPEWPSAESYGWTAEQCWQDCSNGRVPSPIVKGAFILKAAITAQHNWSSPWQIWVTELSNPSFVTQTKRSWIRTQTSPSRLVLITIKELCPDWCLWSLLELSEDSNT